jgi:hypothetical protein
MQTTELDTTQETPSHNGHHDWQTFDDDQAFLQHILSKKPPEKLVEVPEWNAKILCRALNAEVRLDVQMTAYDEKSKRTDFRKAFHLIVLNGVYNPTTGNRIFSEAHKNALMREQDGGAVEMLALTILRLSRMLPDDSEIAKKN